MKRTFISISFIIILCTLLQAQKEVIFSNIKTEDIKVESLKGLEMYYSYNPSLYSNTNIGMKFFSYPLYIGYFNEKGIGKNWSLTTRIGLINTLAGNSDFKIVRDSLTGYDSYLFDDSKYLVSYSIRLNLGIEPRWYWDYQNRFQKGSSKLNSGLFLSFPVNLFVPLIQTPVPKLNLGWFPGIFQLTGTITPSIGFRQAISKQWFLEGSVGMNASMYAMPFSHGLIISQLTVKPELRIKASYIFK